MDAPVIGLGGSGRSGTHALVIGWGRSGHCYGSGTDALVLGWERSGHHYGSGNGMGSHWTLLGWKILKP